MADDEAPPPPAPDYHETPYVMQHPDGSTETRVLRSDRPITHGELSDYVASRGAVYMGPPQPAATTTTTTPPPPAPTAQPPSLMQAFGGYDLGSGSALSQAFAPPSPGLPEAPPGYERVSGALLPHRTLGSQVPAIVGATILGRTGSAAGTELGGPEVGIVTGALGAGAGGALGEGGRIVYEKATGAEPAEPGTAWQRVGNAAIRSAAFEGLTAPLRILPMSVAASAQPAADAMQELEPVLTGKVAGPLTDWWATWSQKPAADMAKEWFGKTAQEQAQLAGDQLPAMQDLMQTVAKGTAPVGKIGYGLYGASATALPRYLASGQYDRAAMALYPAAREAIREGTPVLMTRIARSGSPGLLSLPRIAQTAAPYISAGVRGTAQTYGAQNWGDAETTLEPPRPPP